MPTRKPHKWFCKRWNIRCLFHDRSKCPLDDQTNVAEKDWHSLHHRKELIDYSTIEKPQTIDGCLKWVRNILENLEPHFEEFRLRFPDAPVAEVRLCWTAHLAADFACEYWYVGYLDAGHPPVKDYGQIKDDYFWKCVTEAGKDLVAG